jgi:hypothetical protein
MMKHAVAALALGVGTMIYGVSEAAPDQGRFNGIWSVQMVTESGLCDRTYGYTLAIDSGVVRYVPAPGDSPTTVTGQVTSDGSVDLDFRRSIAKADASGQLKANRGSGWWKLNMLGCSGRWVAQRRSA